jgi:cellulose biosynthesis protein BcsQ
MGAKVYAFLSPKGGAGKTTAAIALANVLAGLSRTVLLVDADASTNGLSLIFMEEILREKARSGGASPAGSFEASGPETAVATEISSQISVLPATYRMGPYGRN